jgi:hypothetical protein
MRSTTRRTIRGRSVRIECRALEARAVAGGLCVASGYVGPSKGTAPVCDRPIALEVSRALSGGPIRFPSFWFGGGQ